MLDELTPSSEDTLALESPAPGWLSSKVLCACRKGNLTGIQACCSGKISLCLVGHMLLQAAAHGLLPMVKYLYARFERNVKPLRVLWNLQFLNALERAVLVGHCMITDFLLKRGFQIGNLSMTMLPTLA
jgi:hypothetical protein